MKKTQNLYHFMLSPGSPLGTRHLAGALRLSVGLIRNADGVVDLQRAGHDGDGAATMHRRAAPQNKPMPDPVEDTVELLPFTALFDHVIDKVLLIRDANDSCSMGDGAAGACDPSELRYRIGDVTEPSYCARHFYQGAVAGDGVTWFKLTDDSRST